MLEQSKEYLAAVKSPQRQVDARFTLNNRVYTGRQLAKLDYDQAIVSGTSYTFGGAYVAGLTVEIKELVEGLMEMMPSTAEIGISVDGAMEYKPIGQFFVTDIELDRNTNSTKLKLQDGFCKLNGEYQSRLNYPTTARAVFSEICQRCNISTMPMNIPDTIILGTKLEKTSYREAIQYIAQLVGSYAIFNRKGQLEFRNIQKLSYRVNRDNYVMGGFKRKEIKFRLHGIECEIDNNRKISVGSSSGNIVQIKNPWMNQMYLEELFAKVQGFTFYPYSLHFQGDPCLDVGDWIEVEFSKGEYFQAPILVEKLYFDGGLHSEIAANTTGVSDSIYQYKSPLARKVEYLEGRISADGLSQVYSGLDEPNPAHLKKGDTWFKPNGTDIDILMWDGNRWVVHNSREKFDELKREFEDQEQYFDELKKKFEEQNKYFKELDAEFETSKQILDSAKDDLDNAKLELESNKQSIKDNEKLIQQSSDELSGMREKFNQVDSALESQQGLFEEFGNELRNNISLTEELDRKSSLFESGIKAIQSNTKDLMDSYRGIYDKTRDLDSAMNNIDSAMNNLFVGSKNYVRETLSKKLTGSTGVFNQQFWSIPDEYLHELSGKECTFSIDFDIENCTVENEEINSSLEEIYPQFKQIKQITAVVQMADEQGEYYSYGIPKELYRDKATTYKQRQYVTFKLPENLDFISVFTFVFPLKSGKAELSKPMLVIGNVKNAFIPSTEETETAIVDLSKIETDRQLSELRTEVGRDYVKTADYSRDTTSLKNRLTDVEGYGTKISSLEQTVGSFKSEMVQKNKDQDQKYSSLEQTVNGFKTTVASVTNEQGTMKNRISALEQTDSTFKSSITAAENRIDTILRDGSNIISDDPVFGSYMNNVTKDGKRAKITCNPHGGASFYIQAKQLMTSGMSYSISFDCSGVQTGDELFFYIDGNSDENKLVKLKNGRNTKRFIRYSDGVLVSFSHAHEKSKFSGTRNLILDNFEIHSMGLANAITLTHSNIIQTADSIRSEVTQKVSGIDGKITTLSTTVNQTAEGIKTEVTRKITAVDGRVTTLNNTVTQTANSWAVKNIKNAKEIVSQINLNGADVYIHGKNIALDGNTHIVNGTIKTAHIGDAQITNTKIGNAAITSAKIQDASIVNAKIADAAITNAKIANATITGAKIARATITNANIASATIGTAEIKDAAIINAKIANGAITSAKIGNAQILAAHIKDASITNAKIANLDASKITTGTMSADRIYGGIINAKNGAMRIDLNSSNIEFNYSSSINFKSGSNAIKRIKNGCTGFLHFHDDAYGGVYVGLGVTSSNEGLNSQNTSRFAGVRIFRPNDKVDKVEMYGDEITFSHAFDPKANALIIDPLKFSRNFTMSEIINSISSLWRCWAHLNNTRWTIDDNFANAVWNEYNSYRL